MMRGTRACPCDSTMQAKLAFYAELSCSMTYNFIKTTLNPFIDVIFCIVLHDPENWFFDQFKDFTLPFEKCFTKMLWCCQEPTPSPKKMTHCFILTMWDLKMPSLQLGARILFPSCKFKAIWQHGPNFKLVSFSVLWIDFIDTQDRQLVG